MTTPIVERHRANGLEHFVLRFPAVTEEPKRRTVVLCHGFLDQSYSFSALGEMLGREGFEAVAFDFRGHGRTEWIGAGGYYHFPDYCADLDQLLPQIADGPVHLLGHSMGGTVASMYAAIRPERLISLTLAEGLGPAETAELDDLPARHRRWLDGVAEAAAKRQSEHPRPLPDVEAALRRMRILHPDLADDLGLMLAEESTREVPGGVESSATILCTAPSRPFLSGPRSFGAFSRPSRPPLWS